MAPPPVEDKGARRVCTEMPRQACDSLGLRGGGRWPSDPGQLGPFLPGKPMSLVHLAERGSRREITLAPILCPPSSFVIGQGHRSVDGQTPRAGGDRSRG